MNKHAITPHPISPMPPDDPQRSLKLARPNEDQSLPHIGLVGDTYTILLSGNDTNGRYCLIDMLVPPGGGPGPHRHDFEESFTVLEGEIEATFRGKKSVVRSGETANIPANAPHSFTNASKQTVRLLCICAPAREQLRQALQPAPNIGTPPYCAARGASPCKTSQCPARRPFSRLTIAAATHATGRPIPEKRTCTMT